MLWLQVLCWRLGAIVAVLAATHAFAQPATRPPQPAPGLRGRTTSRRRARRRAAPLRRPDTRPAGALPDFDNPESSELPRFGNPPGSGASKTGFISTNTQRRPDRPQCAPARKPAPGGRCAAPLSLTAPGTSPTAALSRTTASGTSARAATAPAATARASDTASRRRRAGRAAAQSAGAHSRRHGGRRHRRHRQHHAPDHRIGDAAAPAHGRRRKIRIAPLGLRTGAFLVLPARRSDRRLRHQSGAHAGGPRARRS